MKRSILAAALVFLIVPEAMSFIVFLDSQGAVLEFLRGFRQSLIFITASSFVLPAAILAVAVAKTRGRDGEARSSDRSP